jgi:hypothetical protein
MVYVLVLQKWLSTTDAISCGGNWNADPNRFVDGEGGSVNSIQVLGLIHLLFTFKQNESLFGHPSGHMHAINLLLEISATATDIQQQCQ